MDRAALFHPMCNANCSGALVLFTVRRSMSDSVLEVVHLKDVYFSLLKTLYSELLSTPSHCDHIPSVFAEAYCVRYRIALMLFCN